MIPSGARGRMIFSLSKKLFWMGGLVGLRTALPFRPNHYGLIVAFKPGDERGAIRARKALLVQVVVVGAEVGIDERSDGIELRRRCGDHLVHRLLLLTRRESYQQRNRLRAA